MSQLAKAVSQPETSLMPNYKRRLDRRRLLQGVLAGIVLGIAGLLVYLFVFVRNPLPVLTESTVAAAERKWDEVGPASYNLDLELSGNRPGKVHVEVRDRRVTKMSRDGVVPSQRRTWDAWSVPGQFDTIYEEFDLAADPSEKLGDPAATSMYIRGEFDPKFGYPVRYHRLALGTNNEIGWKVVRFEVVN
jgi:hypothetical protein